MPHQVRCYFAGLASNPTTPRSPHSRPTANIERVGTGFASPKGADETVAGFPLTASSDGLPTRTDSWPAAISADSLETNPIAVALLSQFVDFCSVFRRLKNWVSADGRLILAFAA